MAKRVIEISSKETNHSVAREYANVYDNGLVEIRRSVLTKLSDNVVDNPNNTLTVEQIKKLAEELQHKV